MTGTVFNIQKFCTRDGPGIRTTVFLKGCPLRCVWCHNPESQSPEKQLLFFEKKCAHCGRCRALTVDTEGFVCQNGAKKICGKVVESGEVLSEVLKDRAFYRCSGGGVTLSGGEPLWQFDFSLELLKACREQGISTAIETSGYAPSENVEAIAGYVDLFLYDFKESDPARHKAYTGADNRLILENLRLLNEMKKDVVLRCPVIPGYNDRREHYEGIGAVADAFEAVRRVEVEPYNALGESKYTALGRQPPRVIAMSKERVGEVVAQIASKTKKPVTLA